MTALEQAVAEALDEHDVGSLFRHNEWIDECICGWRGPNGAAGQHLARVAVSALLSALTEEGLIREAAMRQLALYDKALEHINVFDAALSAAATVKESKE